MPVVPDRKQLSDNTDIYQKHPYLFAPNHCREDKGHDSVTGVQTGIRIKLEIMKNNSRKTWLTGEKPSSLDRDCKPEFSCELTRGKQVVPRCWSPLKNNAMVYDMSWTKSALIHFPFLAHHSTLILFKTNRWEIRKRPLFWLYPCWTDSFHFLHNLQNCMQSLVDSLL